MAPTSIIEPLALVAAVGSSAANGTTNASIEAAGKNALATSEMGTRNSSIIW